MDNDEVNQLKARIDKLEHQGFDEFLTLVEIMSNATFFGDMKRTTCEHAKQGQCTFFTLEKTAREKIPIATRCRIKNCPDQNEHYHIEISNITCTLCPKWQDDGH